MLHRTPGTQNKFVEVTGKKEKPRVEIQNSTRRTSTSICGDAYYDEKGIILARTWQVLVDVWQRVLSSLPHRMLAVNSHLDALIPLQINITVLAGADP